MSGQSTKEMKEIKGVKKILFDLDGVITSEHTYWKTAALSVYEYFNNHVFDPKYCYENSEKIMSDVFADNKTIKTVKNLGINSNWDLTYVVIIAADILKLSGVSDSEIFDAIPDFLESKQKYAPELFDALSNEYERLSGVKNLSRESDFYERIKDTFQEWYLGDKLYFEYTKKLPKTKKGDNGAMISEEPLIGLPETQRVLSQLYNCGYTLGIGTGRPYIEVINPLKRWDLLKYFNKDRIVCYDEVISCEKEYKEKFKQNIRLAKPHPFTFLKASKGEAFTLDDLEKTESDETVLVVGDALCDLIAAKKQGFKFCAVLTGIEGKSAKKYFEEQGADYIVDDVRFLIEN